MIQDQTKTKKQAISKREIEIGQEIAFGHSSKEIANKLFLSVETVNTHKKNLSRKIKAHNIADITRWYFESATGQKLKRVILTIVALFTMALPIKDRVDGNSASTEIRLRRKRK